MTMTRKEHVYAVAYCTRGCQICRGYPAFDGLCCLCAEDILRKHKQHIKDYRQAGHSSAWKRVDDAPRWPRKVMAERTFPEIFYKKDLPGGAGDAVTILSLLYGPRSVEAVELLGKIRKYHRNADIAQALNETILIMDEPRPMGWAGLLGMAVLFGVTLLARRGR